MSMLVSCGQRVFKLYSLYWVLRPSTYIIRHTIQLSNINQYAIDINTIDQYTYGPVYTW